MKRIPHYFLNVLFTLFLVFSLICTEMTLLVQRSALNVNMFHVVVQQEGLTDKAYDKLETYFKTRANSTGIPEAVFLRVVDKEMIYNGIMESVTQSFEYLNGNTSEYQFTMDFTEMEQSVTEFFEEYADVNGYQKDDIYQEKLTAVIEESEKEILFVVDNFKFTMLYEKGWLAKLRQVVGYLNVAVTVCLAVTIVLAVIIVFLNKKKMINIPYWLGLSAFTAGVLVSVPCFWVTHTNYFSGFVVTDPQIFSAVVGYLNLLVNRAFVMAVVTICIGIVGFGGFGALCLFQRTEE
ncbi:MAG TPA: hypothetical protein DCO72_11455 [Ruminococcus sp.]|nr:hypothetical protein [Ruminococcus sp.]